MPPARTPRDPGPRRPRWPGPPTIARALVVVSLVVCAVAYEPTDVALLALVAGGAAIPLGLRLPPLLDTLYVGALLVAAWSSVLDLYETVPGWDLVVHVVATGIIALVAHAAVRRLGAAPPLQTATTRGERLGAVVLVTGLGGLLSIAWEVGEWWGNTYLDPTIGVGYVDTVGDLAAGALGSAGAAVVALAVSRRTAAERPTAPTAASPPTRA